MPGMGGTRRSPPALTDSWLEPFRSSLALQHVPLPSRKLLPWERRRCPHGHSLPDVERRIMAEGAVCMERLWLAGQAVIQDHRNGN